MSACRMFVTRPRPRSVRIPGKRGGSVAGPPPGAVPDGDPGLPRDPWPAAGGRAAERGAAPPLLHAPARQLGWSLVPRAGQPRVPRPRHPPPEPAGVLPALLDGDQAGGAVVPL